MSRLSALLVENAIFKALAPADQTQAEQVAFLRRYQRGENVVLFGDVWPYLLLVADGLLEALKESSEGRNLHVARFSQGEVFWGLAFFREDAPMPVSLEAREDCQIYLWSRAALLPILLRNGSASWELSRLMAERMQRVSDLVEGLAFQPVAGRLARLLLDHFIQADESSISRNLTLDEMAARVGSTREMVCRALYNFSDKKLIEVTRTEFVLTDREGLARLVGPG
ncbi:MAG: Crp/Fnr family transcriptional regulator [Anaerolineales bacterium]|nr:MAG: Crp/Fnr family transcriptional regulator [Anaerolineales bacterium]